MKATEAGMEVGESMVKTDIKSGETAVKKLTATGEVNAQAGVRTPEITATGNNMIVRNANGNPIVELGLDTKTNATQITSKKFELFVKDDEPSLVELGIQDDWCAIATNQENGMRLRANEIEMQDLDERRIISVRNEEDGDKVWTKLTTGTEAMRFQTKKFELCVEDDEPSLIDI